MSELIKKMKTTLNKMRTQQKKSDFYSGKKLCKGINVVAKSIATTAVMIISWQMPGR